MNTDKFSRRIFIRNTSLLAAGTIAGSVVRKGNANMASNMEGIVKNDRIHQSVSKWCFGKIPLDEFCVAVKQMGLKGVDLLGPRNFATLKKYGLICTMSSGGGNLNDKARHKQTVEGFRKSIEATAECGWPNIIGMSGSRKGGIPDDVGIDNAVAILKDVAGLAEKKKVTICIEYLNSKVNHPGYMFDNMKWGVDVCKKVGSERVKILYDIYHAQIMEGDIIRTIRNNSQYIGHYHTGGNPGRNDIDETQELYYPAIMRAILDTGFKGWVAHEFIPKNGLKSLARGVEICDV